MLLLLLLLSPRYGPATPPEIPLLLLHRLSVAELLSLRDSSSCLLSHLPKFPAVSVSNLAIAVAACFRQRLAALASSRRSRPICDRRQTDQPSESQRFGSSSPQNDLKLSGCSSLIFSGSSSYPQALSRSRSVSTCSPTFPVFPSALPCSSDALLVLVPGELSKFKQYFLRGY